MDNPNEYTPSVLRQSQTDPRLDAWTVGDEGYDGRPWDASHQWNGPFRDLTMALEVVGRSSASVIRHHRPDGTDVVVYRWHPASPPEMVVNLRAGNAGKWVREPEVLTT